MMFCRCKAFVSILLVAALVGVFAPQYNFAQENSPYQEPTLQQDGAWTLVLVPDPQAYTRYARNQGILDLMTAWISENVQKLNIKQVVCVGDLVESNNLQRGDGKFANQTSSEMWSCTKRAFERLDCVVPYVLTTGNHDYGPYIYPDGNHYGTRSSLNRETQFNSYFSADSPRLQSYLYEMGENAFGEKTLENAFYQFEGTNGRRVLIAALEFAPRDETLAWVKEIFERPENADAFGIIVTHSYMRPYLRDCERDPSESYGLNKEGGNAGQAIWEKLVYSTANIRMVLCGHHSTADEIEGCAGFRSDINEAGKTVSQILFDAQAMGGGWEGNGGDGWLQLLEFSQDMRRVKVRTFSPLFAISPSTRDKAWDRSERLEYEFSVE